MEEKKLKKFLKIFQPFFKKILAKQFKEKHITATQLKNSLKKLREILLELKEEGEEEICYKIKEIFLIFYESEFEEQIEDYLLRKAVKVLKYEVLRKREIDNFFLYLAEEIRKDLLKIKSNELKLITEEIIPSLLKIKKLPNKKFIEDLIALIEVISYYFLVKISKSDFKKILNLLKALMLKIEREEDLGFVLSDLINFSLEKLGIIRCMRRAFTGLFLSELLLSALFRGLGLRGRVSIVDFIIFIISKIAEKEIFEYFPKKEAKKLRLALEEIRE